MKRKKIKNENLLEFFLATYMKIVKRCMLEGCRYGYFPTDKLADKCIYCHQPRPIFEDFGKVISLRKFLKKKVQVR